MDTFVMMPDLPPGAELIRQPELPMCKMKIGEWKVKVTDLRYLNKTAVNVIEASISYIIATWDAREVKFAIPIDVGNAEIDIVRTICTSLMFSAKKRGVEMDGHFLICGAKTVLYEGGGGILTLELIRDHARAIYNYFQQHPIGGNIEYSEIVAIVLDEAEISFALLKEKIK